MNRLLLTPFGLKWNPFNMYPALRQRLNDTAQIIEIPRKAIHTMYHHGVAGAGETHQCFQLRAFDILARSLVGERTVNLDAFQLPFRVLVEGADPDVPNALSVHGLLLRSNQHVFDQADHRFLLRRCRFGYQ
ncbi:hypothetical protein B1A_01608 [mine drainage metagenome]|uniref:Uncharacterized protein n=1 Tax=mine drainage metagenome TaxID=410659 RepID=T1DC61_9ZZZZ